MRHQPLAKTGRTTGVKPGRVSVAGGATRADTAALSNRQRFLAACHGRPTDRPPVWLMRQAVRALPEYRKLKEKYTFLQLVQTPELAAEVTLQPIRRFGFDAAILFSDILVVCEGLGQRYQFRDRGGIEMEFLLKSAADIDRLDVEAVTERLQYVAQALPMIKSALGGHTALIGFAGSPWTLANFMLEGGGVKEYTQAKALFYSDP
ncbi:MAG TPA: uroporphyrinogen decarboxylase family protein, partial [Candidatus Saccharimonadales bacterium]|nr:uroporphyrinogen decarboxylase family protein [Candidatus Saccharimonadales bacterium]